MQIANEVPEGSRADMTFRRVPAQMADEVPDGSGAYG